MTAAETGSETPGKRPSNLDHHQAGPPLLERDELPVRRDEGDPYWSCKNPRNRIAWDEWLVSNCELCEKRGLVSPRYPGTLRACLERALIVIVDLWYR